MHLVLHSVHEERNTEQDLKPRESLIGQIRHKKPPLNISEKKTVEIRVADLQFPAAPVSSTRATTFDWQTTKILEALVGIRHSKDPPESEAKEKKTPPNFKEHHCSVSELSCRAKGVGGKPSHGPTRSSAGKAPPDIYLKVKVEREKDRCICHSRSKAISCAFSFQIRICNLYHKISFHY